jgi:hypothetical protein
VTVGVLSDSYNCEGGAASDIASDDLPAGVVVLREIADCSEGTDEGRAMMQIVHDVAPGAALAFHTAFDGIAGFANGIVELATVGGADVITDDVIYLSEPMFQDGEIAQAVDNVHALGVAYFSSAGNQARKSYEAQFIDSGQSGYRKNYIRHDFDTSAPVDTLQAVTIPSGASVTIVLQWQDPAFSVSGSPGAATDLDIYLYNEAGTAAVAGSSYNNIGNDPVEIVDYTNNSGTDQTYQLAIDLVRGPLPGKIKYVYYGSMGVQEYVTNSSTLYGHSNAAGAVATGAARYDKTPAFGKTPPVLESFSSKGGTPILFDTAGNPVNILRQKPEITGPDGGNNTFFGSDYDNDGFPNFFGTSASAPHAAGVAALLRQLDAGLTPAAITTALTSTAIDMNSAGFDNRSGYGLVQADAALASLDSDADGILNTVDNCTLEQNTAQIDTDGDGYGNACDPDFDNNLIINFADLAVLKAAFFSSDADADLNGDGIVNFADLSVIKAMFFLPPGPSALVSP